jgi:YHS domain-containing protein
VKITILCFIFILIGLQLSAEQTTPVNAKKGVAIRGYDPVAYFEMGKPIQGKEDHGYSWRGVMWHFANEANKKLFSAAPEKYAPQFGGYCAFAASRNYVYDADPTFWKIVDGKLYLNYNAEAKAEWEKDITGNIAKGNTNWPGLLKNNKE